MIPQGHKSRIRRAASAIIRLQRIPFTPEDRATTSWNRGINAGILIGLDIGMETQGVYSVHTVMNRYLRRFGPMIAECMEREDAGFSLLERVSHTLGRTR